MGIKHIRFNELIWEQVRIGVSRKVVHSSQGTVVLNKLESGHEPRPHRHSHEQISTIIKGETSFTVGENVYEMKEGDVIVIPPNTLHFAQVTKGDYCLNLDFFVPRRDDYTETKTASCQS